MTEKTSLQVQCLNCKKLFASPIQMDAASFASSSISNNTTNCPHCHKMTSFGKENMRIA